MYLPTSLLELTISQRIPLYCRIPHSFELGLAVKIGSDLSFFLSVSSCPPFFVGTVRTASSTQIPPPPPPSTDEETGRQTDRETR